MEIIPIVGITGQSGRTKWKEGQREGQSGSLSKNSPMIYFIPAMRFFPETAFK